jgi:hypothetical protein
MIDIHRYDDSNFNKNTLINKRIKALFLLFDKYVDDSKLNHFESQRLMNLWIKTFIEQEEYELAEAFKQRKIRMWKSWRKIHRFMSFKLFYRFWRIRIFKLFKK